MEETQLIQIAVEAALEGDWEKAIRANRQILKSNPQDPDALNRLARAHLELGDNEKAKHYYSQVVKIDPPNSIALKNLKLLTKSENCNGKNGQNKNLSLDIFLSEPGRTKLVNLVNLATPTTLSTLTCGEKVSLVFKKHQVLIESLAGEYLGAVPDDLAHYLISLAKAGNGYEAYIKAINTNALTAIIAEKKRVGKFANQPSFLLKRQPKRLKLVSEEAVTPQIEDLAESFAEFSEL